MQFFCIIITNIRIEVQFYSIAVAGILQKRISRSGNEMTKEVMNLSDECIGEMQYKICGSVHIAKRDHNGKYPPEPFGVYTDVN
jgi:hypothetical protein